MEGESIEDKKKKTKRSDIYIYIPYVHVEGRPVLRDENGGGDGRDGEWVLCVCV